MNFTKKSVYISLGVLFGLTFLLLYFTSHFILTNNFFDKNGEYLSGNPEQELGVYNSLQKYIYIFSGLYMICKVFIVSVLLHMSLYLSDKEVDFAQVANIAILCEFIFVLQSLVKIIWFRYEYPTGTLADWNRVQVFSAISLARNVPLDWVYPLQTLNVFEVTYMFLLAYGVHLISGFDFDRSLRLILVSYLPALFIWISIISFLTIMLAPGNA